MLDVNIIRLKERFSANRQFIIFSFLKYVEYAINAFLFFSIAKHVSPDEYGSASSSFLLISYSGFVVLGVNQVLVKHYSIQNDNGQRNNLLAYSFFYNSIFCGILFLLIFYSFNKDYVIYISLVCASKLMSEGIVTIFRVTGKVLFINLIYILQALLFLSLYFILVETIADFFKAWALSALTGAMLSIFILYTKKIMKGWNWKSFQLFWTRYNKKLFFEGLLFTGISLISILYISIDRFFYINIYKFDNATLGTIQLSDSISNVVSLGISSLLFILTPSILTTLSKSSESELKKFTKKWYQRLMFLLVIIILFAIPLSIVIERYYVQYEYIKYPLFMSLIIKFCNIALFVPSTLYIVNNKELFYIKISSTGVLLMVFFLIVCSFLKINNDELYYIVPIIILMGIVAVHLLFKFFFTEIKSKT